MSQRDPEKRECSDCGVLVTKRSKSGRCHPCSAKIAGRETGRKNAGRKNVESRARIREPRARAATRSRPPRAPRGKATPRPLTGEQKELILRLYDQGARRGRAAKIAREVQAPYKLVIEFLAAARPRQRKARSGGSLRPIVPPETQAEMRRLYAIKIDLGGGFFIRPHRASDLARQFDVAEDEVQDILRRRGRYQEGVAA